MLDEDNSSLCWRSFSYWSNMPCLSPSRRALMVLGIVIFVAILKSFMTRTSILSTQAIKEGPEGHIQMTGIAFSALSCATTVLCMICVFIFEPGTLATPDVASGPALLVITIFSTIDLGCTNAAIARLPAATQQVLAALNPIFTITIESVLGCQLKHPLLYLSVFALTVGAAFVADSQLITHGGSEYVSTGSEGTGVLLMIIAVMSSALKYVLLRKLSVRTKHQVGTVSFVFWVDMIAFVVLSSIAIVSGEFDTLIQSLLDAPNTLMLSIGTFISSSLGGLRLFTEIFALRFVAAIDLSAAKSLASVLFIVISLFVPGEVVNAHAPQFEIYDWGDRPNTAWFVFGLLLVFTSLGAYWILQRWLGPEGVIAVRCQPTAACSRVAEIFFGVADAEEVSDMAVRDGSATLPSIPGDCCACFCGSEEDRGRPEDAP